MIIRVFILAFILLLIPFSLSNPVDAENEENLTNFEDNINNEDSSFNGKEDDFIKVLETGMEQTEISKQMHLRKIRSSANSFKFQRYIPTNDTHDSAKQPGFSGNTGSNFSSSNRSNGNSEQTPSSLGYGRTPNRFAKIMRGTTSDQRDHPWFASLRDSHHNPHCGGILLDRIWVMTAAHCAEAKEVSLGSNNFEHGTRIPVAGTWIHHNYNSDSLDNDIALLKLRYPVPDFSDNIHPATLSSNRDPPNVHNCRISGFGFDENDHWTAYLQDAPVSIANGGNCAFKSFISQNQLCAGNAEGLFDMCSGDSGGPLTCYVNGQWKVYGIASYGTKCRPDKRETYHVYTKVASYESWIASRYQLR